MSAEHDESARAVVDGARYMTLATAGASGSPWASPVWYATADNREFLWASKPGAQHSQNIAARPEVSIVLFDSHVPPGTGGGLYLAARAGLVPDDELDRCVAIFSAESLAQEGTPFTRDDVSEPAPLRLYRAIVSQAWLGGRDDLRVPVDIGR